MKENTTVTPTGNQTSVQNSTMEKVPDRSMPYLTEQLSAYPLSVKPNEPLSQDQLRDLGLLLPPLDEVEDLEIERIEKEETLEKIEKGHKILIPFILVVAGIIAFIIGVAALATGNENSFTVLFLMFGFSVPFPCLIVLLMSLTKYTSAKNRLPKIYTRLDQLRTEVGWGAITVMPPAYRNTDAISFTCSAIFNGRATTLQEAINLYEQELHNLAMRGMQAAALKAAEDTRVAANTAAVASFISLLK